MERELMYDTTVSIDALECQINQYTAIHHLSGVS
jgi:hypothetical protein